ncbi:uncharacterized protein LOC144799898 isoform X2 [Lissotriton helveticus]
MLQTSFLRGMDSPTVSFFTNFSAGCSLRHYLPECSAVELVNKILKPHSSSHKVRRDISLVNISAVPVPDGIVWDKYEAPAPARERLETQSNPFKCFQTSPHTVHTKRSSGTRDGHTPGSSEENRRVGEKVSSRTKILHTKFCKRP